MTHTRVRTHTLYFLHHMYHHHLKLERQHREPNFIGTTKQIPVIHLYPAKAVAAAALGSRVTLLYSQTYFTV